VTVIARAVAAAVCDVIGRFPTVLPGKQVSHVASRRRPLPLLVLFVSESGAIGVDSFLDEEGVRWRKTFHVGV
jgi:hypothetical protein